MNVAARLGAFAVAVLIAFGAGHAVGAAVGPIDDPDPATDHSATDRPATDQDGAPGSHRSADGTG